MPIPGNIVRCALRWRLPGGEVAVNTLHVWVNHGTGEVLDFAGGATQKVADKVMGHFNDVWGGIRQRTSNEVIVDRVDAYHLSAQTGKALDKATALAPAGAYSTGGDQAGSLPPQIAVVVSLYGYHVDEFVVNGRNRRGRLYIPGPGKGACDGHGRLNAATVYRDGIKAWIDAISGDSVDSFLGFPGGDLVPVILSKSTGTMAPIQQVRCDDVFDTQRRRSNALVPVVSVAAANP